MARPGANLYRIQGAVLDELSRLGMADRDGYSQQLAQLYLSSRTRVDQSGFIAAARRIRTGTFGVRRGSRAEATDTLVRRLDSRFLADLERWRAPVHTSTEQPLRVVRLGVAARIRATGPAAFQKILAEYRSAIRLHGVDEFWESRRKGQLRARPESLAQHSLTMFLSPIAQRDQGYVFREIHSGTGYVDVLVILGSCAYIAELKVLRSNRITGLRQLANYLDLHELAEGWLVLFDARSRSGRSTLEDHDELVAGKLVHVVVIDINPAPPSSLDNVLRK